jgi:hypothetical protein
MKSAGLFRRYCLNQWVMINRMTVKTAGIIAKAFTAFFAPEFDMNGVRCFS